MFGTIGILTGGGDAPALNAVIRAVVKTATCEHGMRVIGIEDGFEGLLGASATAESLGRAGTPAPRWNDSRYAESRLFCRTR